MFYRRKILLALIESFGGELGATDFQKLLFLFSDEQNDKDYEFVPYKFGCFSFQAMADKNKLIEEGFLLDNKNWENNFSNTSFVNVLKEDDRKSLGKIKRKFGSFNTEELIKYIYLNYPYFAINSEIAANYLSKKELKVVEKFKPKELTTCLYTIGYEGKTLEKYLNELIRNNIKVLCDVRKNPLSRKYGFSKRTLQNACESLNIKYIHFPELGIISEKRQNLRTQSDYDALFCEYENTVLEEQPNALNLLSDLVKNYKRIALTCFEASPLQCHRSKVANAVIRKEKYPLTHI